MRVRQKSQILTLHQVAQGAAQALGRLTGEGQSLAVAVLTSQEARGRGSGGLEVFGGFRVEGLGLRDIGVHIRVTLGVVYRGCYWDHGK